ncbi:MAG: hypothetical protein SF029_00915 [bacterium]|nr:hypothetical protein [bacterium]
MIKRLFLLWVFKIAFFASIQPPSWVVSQTTHAFASYVASDYSNGSQIVLLAPDLMAIEYVEMPIEPDWNTPARVLLSPNGEWIAYATSLEQDATRTLTRIRILNLRSNDFIDVPSGNGYLRSLAWSTDSDYLLFEQLRQMNEADIFLYNVNSNTTSQLTNQGIFWDSLAWSPNNEQIAVASIGMLQIIDVPSGQIETTVNFEDLNWLLSWIAWYNTNLQWSPDGRYISFVKGFAPTYVADRASEVFLWDVQEQALRQVTDFVSPVFRERGEGIAPVTYTTQWYDEDTLLIGVTYLVEVEVAITGTYRYEVGEQTLTQIADLQMDDAAINPATNEVVVHLSISDITGQSAAEIQAVENVETFRVGPEGNLEAQTTAYSNNLPNGCRFFWSNDGSWLAYQPRKFECPYTGSDGFIFVNTVTGELREFAPVLPDGAQPVVVTPLGWVQR